MIKKNIIGLCLLTGLTVISCKKNETRQQDKFSDSTAVSQPAGIDSASSKTMDSVQTSPSDEKSKDKESESTAKNSLEGTYIGASPCESSRYSIEIKYEDNQPKFKVFDKTKVIASGNASVDDGGILMGEIGATIDGDKMMIQNTGNAMNPYQHFDCAEKYLEFNKKK
jgi:hypothetical protein